MKVGIIGAGNIGSTLSSLLIVSDFVSDISFIDIRDDFLEGRVFDLETMGVILKQKVKINYSTSYEIIKNFDIVVITAGATRKVGQSRDDLLRINADIIDKAIQEISKFAPNSTIIMVTNPLDILTYYAYKKSGFKPSKVIGMAGELDSARAVLNLAKKEQISPLKANAYVLGTHDDDMIVEPNFIADETRKSGQSITKLTGTSAYFAPASAVFKMIKALKFGGEIICSVVDEKQNVAFGKKVLLKDMKVDKILDEVFIDTTKLREKIALICDN